MIDERELSQALQEMAAEFDTGAPPVDRLLRNGRRRRAQRWMAAGVTPAALVGALVLGMGLGIVPSGRSGPPQPPARLPFHFRIEQTLQLSEPPIGSTSLAEGGFDPVRKVGYLNFGEPSMTGQTPSTELTGHLIQVDGVCYDGTGGSYPWNREPNACIFDNLNTGLTGAVGDSAHQLLQRMAAIGTVTDAGRRGTGTDAVQSWRFSYPDPRTPPAYRKQNITGTLEVKVATGQAIRLTVTRPVPQRPDYHIIGSELQVITYRDYGQPVPVVVPTWYTVQPSGAPS